MCNIMDELTDLYIKVDSLNKKIDKIEFGVRKMYEVSFRSNFEEDFKSSCLIRDEIES